MNAHSDPAVDRRSDEGTFLAAARRLLAARDVLSSAGATRAFRTPFRGTEGEAGCVLRPRTLLQFWQALQLCVAHDRVVIVQAANTGLTGGSTPVEGGYDRDVVVINTMALGGIHLVDEARQAVCLAGSTLYELERGLAPHGREPHSVIGSSCIGASVVGGICNNSGGALVRRGPAYTEHALFARVAADGTLELVNHLGLALGDTPGEMLANLETGRFVAQADGTAHACSDHDYGRRIRQVDADAPVRFNGDPGRLHEASGCAGKLAVFAVRVDTFPREEGAVTFYVGTNDAADLATLRRRMLAEATELPISAEYVHGDAFDLADRYGKDIFVAIERLGTDRLPALFRAKDKIDRLAKPLGWRRIGFSDWFMQHASRLLPDHLPKRMREWRRRYGHHLLLKVSATGVEEARVHLAAVFDDVDAHVFRCTPAEQTKAFLHRFAVAGAAVRYQQVHAKEVGGLVALDIALKANDRDWREQLPASLRGAIAQTIYYGHFFCHVFHQDYVLKKGADADAVKAGLLALIDQRGGRYPAEHNVGHLYKADTQHSAFHRALDPTNSLNPGIGKTSLVRDWK